MTLIEAQAEKDYFAAQRLFVMTGQISQLQNICHNMPYVIWQTTDEDTLIWQNKAYNSLSDSFETKAGHGLFDLI